jgi:hypothetical protein
MAVITIPDNVYRIGVERGVALPKGYCVTEDLNHYWLQNTSNTGGVLLSQNKQKEWSSTYYFSKRDAESYIRTPLMRLINYQLEKKN